MHKFINKVLPSNPEITFNNLDSSIDLATDEMEYIPYEFKDLSALDYFIKWLTECRYEMIRLDYENAPMPLQEQLQEYFDKHLVDEWVERAQDSGSSHDYDDIDYFLERAWEMYLEH